MIETREQQVLDLIDANRQEVIDFLPRLHQLFTHSVSLAHRALG